MKPLETPRPHTPTSYSHVCDLASGGMGKVELALRQDGRFRRLYAVKRLHSHLCDDESFRGMFLDEARVAGLIQHPNVVSVLDVGEDESGPFLVMDYIEGVALSTLMKLTLKNQRTVPIQVAVRIAFETAKGLHAAHEVCGHDGKRLDLVHRDLSPQNVLISYAGSVRITDFGIAKALGQMVKTATGVIKGKTQYMAPEQLLFEDPDRRSDLFALGILLFEMLSGEQLYKNREGNDGIQRLLKGPPPDIGEVRSVPPALAELLFDLLAKDRKDRPDTAAEVADRLEALLAELITREEPHSLADYVGSVTREHREEQEGGLAEAIQSAEQRLIGGLQVAAADTPVLKSTMPAAGPRSWFRPALGLFVALLVGGAGAFVLGAIPDDAPAETVDADPISSPSPQASVTPEAAPGASPPLETEELPEEAPAVVPPLEESLLPESHAAKMRRRPRGTMRSGMSTMEARTSPTGLETNF